MLQTVEMNLSTRRRFFPFILFLSLSLGLSMLEFGAIVIVASDAAAAAATYVALYFFFDKCIQLA